MKNSANKEENYVIVCGEMACNEEREFKCPPSTVNNKKKLPQKGKTIPEGEISIKLGYARYGKDENGNIVNVQFQDKDKIPEMPKITGEYKGNIAENGEIIRQTADSER